MKTEMKVLLYLKRNEQSVEGFCPLMGKITVKGKTNSTAQFGCKSRSIPTFGTQLLNVAQERAVRQ